jgi:predicted DsbA family dithiol-disulfide isomerase
MKSFNKAFTLLGLLFAILISGLWTGGCANGTATVSGSKKQKAPAVINNVIVTESEIRGEAADELESIELQKLRSAASYARAEREAMLEALDRVLEEKLLTLEAAEQDISKEQLLDREVRQKTAEPSGEEIDRVYELNRARVNRPKEEVAEQIKEFLRDRGEKEILKSFLGQLEQKHKVVRNLEPFRFDVKTDGRPSIGPNDAPVKLVLFSDFECPYCRNIGETLMEIVGNYGSKVQLVFRQFPLTSIHANAQRAAEASLCARDQKRFWETHDILFENQRGLTEENILTQIKSLDIDTEKFKECLASGRHKPEIREDLRAAAAAGADSTPTLFINGLYLSGGQPYELIAAIIDKELASAE